MSKKKIDTGWLTKPFLITILLFTVIMFGKYKSKSSDIYVQDVGETDQITVSPSPIEPSPTPRPLTFAEMNELYGPCTKTPVFMYHHIQDQKLAVERNQVSLTTYTETFEEQLKYLQSKSYQTIGVDSLISFFQGGSTLQEKSIILTFDDGYTDFYEIAYPILQKYNFKAIVFLPTGLVNNYGYLTWPEIDELKVSGNVYFGNHTWSHYAVIKDEEKIRSEIETADTQLTERSLNASKIFAYPYGSGSVFTQNLLRSSGYDLAFTTNYGTILCAKNNLSLPRLRAGNLMPSYYGL